MITLVGEDRRGLVDELVAWFDTVSRDTTPAVVCLSAPMGWGKTRVIQEFYARLADRQHTPAYWPARIVSAEAADRLERERKRIVPSVSRTPPGAQMPWLWWGISCQRRQDGRLLPAALVDRAQVQTHLGPLLQRLAGRRRDREVSLELVATFVGLVLPDVIDLGLALREVPTWFTEKISRWRAQRREAVTGRTLDVEAAGVDEALAQVAGGLLEILGADLPMVLVVDDLQWADPSLLQFLQRLVEADAPILVVCTALPDALEHDGRLSQWWTSLPPNTAHRRMLRPLPPDDLRRIVHEIAPRTEAGTADALIDRGGRNPLHLCLLLTASAVRRHIRDGAIDMDPADLASIPVTLRDLYALRLEELPEVEQLVLALGAIQGEEFLMELAQDGVRRLVVDPAAGAISTLCARPVSSRVWRFIEPLWFEVVRERASGLVTQHELDDARAALAATARQAKQRPDWQLLSHLEQRVILHNSLLDVLGPSSEAADSAWQLATLDEDRLALHDALRWAETAVALAPDHAAPLEIRATVASLHRRLGDHQAATRLLRDLLTDCERRRGPLHPLTIVTRIELALASADAGDNPAALGLGEEVLALLRTADSGGGWDGTVGSHRILALSWATTLIALAERVGDARFMSRTRMVIAELLDLLQRFDECVSHLEAALVAAKAAQDPSLQAAALCALVAIEASQNPHFGRGTELAELMRLLRELPDQERYRVLWNTTIVHLRLREWDLVDEGLEQLVSLSPVIDELDRAKLLQLRGEVSAQRGAWQEAATTFAAALAQFERLGDKVGICAATGWLGLARCRLDSDSGRGLELVTRALRVERDDLASREGAAKWLQLLGELFLERDEPERALQVLLPARRLRSEVNHVELATTDRSVRQARAALGADHPALAQSVAARTGEFGAFTMSWGFERFVRHDRNPVLIATGSGWDSSNVLNPAAIVQDDHVTLLYRGEARSPHAGSRKLVSALGLAFSDDGVAFRRHGPPVVSGEEWYERPGGCEDPRLVRIEDRYLLTYTAFDGATARLCLAESDDLRTWIRRGPVFGDLGWTKSGAILPDQVHGRWWMYFGDTDIWAAWSEDLIDWIRVPQPVLQRRPGHFDSRLVEPGPPPLLTSQGILMIYNAADDDLRYAVAQCLIDPEQPTHVVRRSSEPLLTTETAGERTGHVDNVVFAEGLVRFRGRWLLYYGMADSAIGLASAIGDP